MANSTWLPSQILASQCISGQPILTCHVLTSQQQAKQLMICHSKSAIDPAPQDIIKTTRWNNKRDAFGMHKASAHSTYA
jgi:hypothetical protein